MSLHRKKRRFIDSPGHAHFFTFSCSHRWPLLRSDQSKGWLVEAIERARTAQKFDLWAYVFMPEHVHLLINPRVPACEMSRVSAAIKYPVSCRAHEFLKAQGQSEWIKRLTVRKGDKEVFQFWQPGTGYDENLWETRSITEVVDYIHANPVRREFVERPTDYEWSSARIHAGTGTGPMKVDPIDFT